MPVCLGKSQGLNDPGRWWGRAAAPCSLYLLFAAPSGGPPQGGAQTGNKGDPMHLGQEHGRPPSPPPHSLATMEAGQLLAPGGQGMEAACSCLCPLVCMHSF